VENKPKKEYLKRRAGVSLESLTKRFREYKVDYSIEIQEPTERYFRETIIFQKIYLKDLISRNIIPSTQLTSYNEGDNYIELNATYNSLIVPPGIAPEIDENHVEITEEYSKRLGDKAPIDWPIDRTRIFKIENEK